MPQLSKPKPSHRRRHLAIGLVALALSLLGGWYFTSEHFHSYVRGRLIAKIEEVTGGHAQIGSVEWNLSRLEFVFYDVTIHGREAVTEAPFVHIDRLYVRAKILSLVRRQIRLKYLEADHPVVHFITYRDGTTNQPAPVQTLNASNLQDLFDLAADRFELRNGTLLVNEQNIPLDLAAGDMRALLTFDRMHNRYDGVLHVGNLTAQYLDFRPVQATAQLEFSLLPHELQIKRMELATDRSTIHATGTVKDFQDPQVNGSYTASISIGQAGEILRSPRFRNGTASITGDVLYRRGRYRAAGDIAVNHATYADSGIVIPAINGQGHFIAENEGISVSGIRGTTLGGSFTGAGKMEVAANPRPGRPSSQRGSAEFRFNGLDPEQLQRALTSSQLRSFPLRGSASGSAEAHWIGSPGNA